MSWTQHPSIQIYRAVDWGYFPDPAYCLWIAHLGDRYIAFKERRWYKTVVTDVAKDIIEDSEGMNIVATYCDPTLDIKTGADVRTMKDIFEDSGIPMEVSVNNREHFAHAVNAALIEEVAPGIPRLQIYKKGCPYLIKTLPQQRFDPKHPLRMADHKDDHAVVTLAYFLISSGSMEKHPIAGFKKLPKWMQPKEIKRLILGSDNVREKG